MTDDSAIQKRIEITSNDFWFKVVECLQQNWALIDEIDSEVLIYFIHDASGVFDRIPYKSPIDAEKALMRNGFRRLREDPEAQEVLLPPEPPYVESGHPNGLIYSSGRFWK